MVTTDKVEHIIKLLSAIALAVVPIVAGNFTDTVNAVFVAGGTFAAALEQLAHAVGSRGK